jgi:hypothetical protein
MRRFKFSPVTAKLRQPKPSRIWSVLPWCAAFASACVYSDWRLNPEPTAPPVDGSAGADGVEPMPGGAAGEQTSGGGKTAGAGGVGDDTETGGAAGESQAGAAGSAGASGAGGTGGCDLGQDFGEPFPVPFSEPGDRTDGRLTADEKTIYFHAKKGISKATWSEQNDRFEDETVVVNHPDLDEMSPSITDDGLELYYLVLHEGIHVARRKDVEEPFEPGELVQNLPKNDGAPFIAPNGNTLYFYIISEGSWTIWSMKKTDGVFADAKPVIILPSEEARHVILPTVSADEKTILFGSWRPLVENDPYSDHSWWVYRATRENDGEDFSGATRIASLVKEKTENQPHWISRDGCRLYFHRREYDFNTLWMASRPALR